MSRTRLDELTGDRRRLLDEILDKWSISVLAALCEGPQRFSKLKAEIGGITQKSLSQTLRRLERNGMIHRHVIDTSPVAVEYRVSDLGRTLEEPIVILQNWAVGALPLVNRARDLYDDRRDADEAARGERTTLSASGRTAPLPAQAH